MRVPPHTEPIEFSAAFTDGGPAPAVAARAIPPACPRRAGRRRSRPRDHAVDREGRLRRGRHRAAARQPLAPQRAPRRHPVPARTAPASASRSTATSGSSAACTSRPEPVRWRRFASGLHEPLTLAIRDEQIYVFDRNGIWRLRDTNGDGEADVHELFSNAFAQTADMREFPSTLRLAPGGEFVIAKGGQEATTIGKHNGSVLRISADGRRATVLGYGLPAAEHRRQRAHRPRHRQRSAGQLHSRPRRCTSSATGSSTGS